MKMRRSNGEAFSALLLFWIFSSLPRLWYVARASGMVPRGAAFAALFFGFLRDGLLVGTLALLGIFLLRFRGRCSEKILASLTFLLLLSLSLIVGIMLVDVEFLRTFGSHANFDHLTMLMEPADGRRLFVND